MNIDFQVASLAACVDTYWKYNDGWIHSLEPITVFTTNLLEGSPKI